MLQYRHSVTLKKKRRTKITHAKKSLIFSTQTAGATHLGKHYEVKTWEVRYSQDREWA